MSVQNGSWQEVGLGADSGVERGASVYRMGAWWHHEARSGKLYTWRPGMGAGDAIDVIDFTGGGGGSLTEGSSGGGTAPTQASASGGSGAVQSGTTEAPGQGGSSGGGSTSGGSSSTTPSTSSSTAITPTTPEEKSVWPWVIGIAALAGAGGLIYAATKTPERRTAVISRAKSGLRRIRRR